ASFPNPPSLTPHCQPEEQKHSYNRCLSKDRKYSMGRLKTSGAHSMRMRQSPPLTHKLRGSIRALKPPQSPAHPNSEYLKPSLLLSNSQIKGALQTYDHRTSLRLQSYFSTSQGSSTNYDRPQPYQSNKPQGVLQVRPSE